MQPNLKRYYTINVSLLIQLNKQQSSIINKKNINILLNNVNAFTPELLAKINSFENDFIISLSSKLLNEVNVLKELLPKLFILISSNFYSKESSAFIPVFFETNADIKKFDSDLIMSYFQSQGIENMRLIFFEYHNTAKTIQLNDDCSMVLYSIGKEGNLNPIYKDKQFENIFSPYIIFGFIDEADTPNLTDRLTSTIETLDSLNKVSFTVEELSKSYLSIKAYDQEKYLWKKRVELYKDFLQLSKTVQQKEYYEVLHWYKNEYEILPLWYKQLGHIIKVIMGKRTFRSLFNDNVKKYKD